MVENLRISRENSARLTQDNTDIAFEFVLGENNINSFSQSNYDTSAVYIDTNIGGYYNWFSATAGSGASSMTSGAAAYSICPSGWKLPTSDSSGDFQGLSSYYSTPQGLMAKPVPAFVFTGLLYASDSSPYMTDQSATGYYWSSTANSSDSANYLDFSSSYVDFERGSGYKYNGRPMRCIKR